MPISPERALAQTKNPAADSDDVGLLLVFYEDRCIGYRGFLPCRAKSGNQTYKVHAPTTFYIDPEYRGRKLFNGQTAASYLNSTIQQSGVDSIGTGISGHSIRYYRKDTRFRPLPPLKYLRIRIGRLTPFTTLVKKLFRTVSSKPLKVLQSLLSKFFQHTVDKLILLILKKRITPDGCGIIKNIDIVQVNEIKPLIDIQAESNASGRIGLHRNEEIINWMLNCPWIAEDSRYIEEYYFARERERFEYLAFQFETKSDHKSVGYAVYSICTESGYTTLKILDYRTVHAKYESVILWQAIRLAIAENANVIEGSFDFMEYIAAKPLLNRLTDICERTYMVWGKKGGVWDRHGYDIKLDYCDCDKPFT